MSEVVVQSYSVSCFIDIDPRKVVFFVSITVQCMMCENDPVRYELKVLFVCFHITLSHYYHYALNLQNACQLYSTECVSKIQSMLSIILMQIWAECNPFLGLSISLSLFVRIFVLHLIHLGVQCIIVKQMHCTIISVKHRNSIYFLKHVIVSPTNTYP